MSDQIAPMFPAARIALNPIQWMASADGWLDPSMAPEPAVLLALVRQAGFDSVMAATPEGASVDEYRAAVTEAGLTLAPGYFVCRSDGRDETNEEVLAGAAHVAREHARLGISHVGLGMGMALDAARIRHPARGLDSDGARLQALIDLIRRISGVMRAEGVRPALHPHVGTWIETEDESRAVLDALEPEELGFLPDTGHLAWAGVDVEAIVRDYGHRVPFVHVKDCRLSVARAARDGDWDYRRTVRGGLWTEPGRGELPLEAVLAALPSSFDGWLMVEVDRPDIADPLESAVASATWMKARYGRK